MTTNQIKRHDEIEITMRDVRACSPTTIHGIAASIRAHCVGINTREESYAAASRAIRHGLAAGWLINYDEESYMMAD